MSKEYIYSGPALLATISGTTTTYHHADHLSVRLTTDANGANPSGQGHFPFGEQWYPAGAPATKWQFTSYERDGGTGESGNDYAMMRYHVNRLGRFSSPDPFAGSLGSPQSLNKYAYVLNDPGNLVDPLGLCTHVCWSLNRYAYTLNDPANLIDPLGLDSGVIIFGVCIENPDGPGWLCSLSGGRDVAATGFPLIYRPGLHLGEGDGGGENRKDKDGDGKTLYEQPSKIASTNNLGSI